MKTKQKILRWTTGLLSAGGALFIAACYGPARPHHAASSVHGRVLLDAEPVDNLEVCVTTDAQDHCTHTTDRGQFHLNYRSDSRVYPEICVRSIPQKSPVVINRTCKKLDSTGNDLEIHVEKSENP